MWDKSFLTSELKHFKFPGAGTYYFRKIPKQLNRLHTFRSWALGQENNFVLIKYELLKQIFVMILKSQNDPKNWVILGCKATCRAKNHVVVYCPIFGWNYVHLITKSPTELYLCNISESFKTRRRGFRIIRVTTVVLTESCIFYILFSSHLKNK